MVVTYDPNEGIFSVAFRLSNTVVPLCYRRVEFWFFLTLHAVIVVLRETGNLPRQFEDQDGHYGMPWKIAAILTGLLTFCIVFYTNLSFLRYDELYTLTRLLEVLAQNYAAELRLRLPGQKPCQRLALRYLLSSHVLFLFFQTGKASTELKRNLEELAHHSLLTRDESKFLLEYRGDPAFLLLHWCLESSREGLLILEQGKDLHRFTGHAFRYRNTQCQIQDTIELMMPFQYFHITSLMLAINLILWAYGMGCTESYLSTIIFFFALLIFMGMKELSDAFSDPFGEDEVDFPVFQWLNETLQSTVALLESQYDFLAEIDREQPALPSELFVGESPIEEDMPRSQRSGSYVESQRSARSGSARSGSQRSPSRQNSEGSDYQLLPTHDD
eukprot:gnl/MRDRNA2_/MRDRNA2_14302_c0_seq1.p1 gnl/MRDRNA2_/MRDRNA2_14302_c0~~gnl/MRDRNA2_/MRDRNA2_14302_c0_seq1.p1  ORF type:complete len:387 (-),score=38.97 gnl/MRDRNA2_/MRDRNA2_14302_c0_seq1:108-1268(-)